MLELIEITDLLLSPKQGADITDFVGVLKTPRLSGKGFTKQPYTSIAC